MRVLGRAMVKVFRCLVQEEGERGERRIRLLMADRQRVLIRLWMEISCGCLRSASDTPQCAKPLA